MTRKAPPKKWNTSNARSRLAPKASHKNVSFHWKHKMFWVTPNFWTVVCESYLANQLTRVHSRTFKPPCCEPAGTTRGPWSAAWTPLVRFLLWLVLRDEVLHLSISHTDIYTIISASFCQHFSRLESKVFCFFLWPLIINCWSRTNTWCQVDAVLSIEQQVAIFTKAWHAGSYIVLLAYI